MAIPGLTSFSFVAEPITPCSSTAMVIPSPLTTQSSKPLLLRPNPISYLTLPRFTPFPTLASFHWQSQTDPSPGPSAAASTRKDSAADNCAAYRTQCAVHA